ncbi:hypothetical protein [Methylocapsa aurea]|uniref:hypothetical protein n=1 Tax=Methylocapsa aurea TaxID=663610 RepID=UPI0012EB7CEB|nr:hypothetical protein [Methylocapsa aurea]
MAKIFMAKCSHKKLFPGGDVMEVLVIGSALFGIILAQFFTFYVLLPGSAIVTILFLVSPVHGAHGLWASLAAIVLLNMSVQFGYLAGLVLSALPATLQRFRGTASRKSAAQTAGARSQGYRRSRKRYGHSLDRNPFGAHPADAPKKIEPAA